MLLKRLLCLFLFAPAFICMHSATPAYATRRDIVTGFKGIRGIAVADFNGDGKPDLAITDVYDKRVLVYLNDGSGAFGAAIVTNVTTAALGLGAMVAGDINGDGKQDLIIGPVAGNQIDPVLLGNGDGTFTQAANIAGSYGFEKAVLVDLNKDGKLDLIVGGNGSTDVFLGDGKGGFTEQLLPAPSSSNPSLILDLVAGDFNRDDKMDFLTAVYQDNSLRFSAGIGNGTFKPYVSMTSQYLTPPSSLAAADFDLDGKLDLLVGAPNIAAILRGNGDGTLKLGAGDFQTIYLPDSTKSKSGVYPPSVAAADCNGDGFQDVIAADPYNNVLSVLLNDGKGSFLQSTPDFSASLAGAPGTLLVADLNGDGLPDIIVTDTKNQAVSYFLSIKQKATSTITLGASTQQVLAGSTVSVVATVSGSGSTKPSGSVTLTDGTQAAQMALDATGTATFSLPSLATGTHSFSASYTGDANFLPGSTMATLAVNIADVTVALPAATQTVSSGATATYTLTLTPAANYTGTVAVSCTGLPAAYACKPATSSLAGQPVTVVLSVAPTNLTSLLRLDGEGSRTGAITCAGLLLVCCIPIRRRPKLFLIVWLIGAGVVPLMLVGCSGGSTTPTTSRYTGTTTFNITTTLSQGTQVLSHTTTATLIVQ